MSASQFQPGQSGNPKGRPKGSRNRLSETFLAELCADWESHGSTVIETVRQQSPEVYLRVVASVIPKDINVQTNPLQDWSDEELDGAIRVLRGLVEMSDNDDEPGLLKQEINR